MKKYVWRNGEHAGDVQHRPGYLGMSWDGQLSSRGPTLDTLKRFPWLEYQELADLVGGSRSLIVPFRNGSGAVEVTPYEDVAFLLQQVPGIDVLRDDGPPNAPPASGGGYVFFLAEGATTADVTANVGALVDALQADLDLLRALHPEDEHDGAEQQPIEETPGYLGMSWDRQLSCHGPTLDPLTTFPLSEYQELLEIVGGTRVLDVAFPDGPRTIEAEAYDDVAVLLSQVPGIAVCHEDGPPDNPASGTGYVIFVAEGSAADDVAANVVALVAALEADLDVLRDLHPAD